MHSSIYNFTIMSFYVKIYERLSRSAFVILQIYFIIIIILSINQWQLI